MLFFVIGIIILTSYNLYNLYEGYVNTSGGLQSSFGKCSDKSDCSSCLSTPDCYWCKTKKTCVSSIDVSTTCMNDYSNSFSQCNSDISGALRYTEYNYDSSDPVAASPSMDTVTGNVNDIQRIEYNNQSSVGTTNDFTPSTRPSSLAYSTAYAFGTSVIPIIGLSRTSEGLLTNSSLSMIVDSLKAKGNNIKDTASKNIVLEMIKSEIDFYNNQYKTDIGRYISNSIDYVADGSSLTKAKDIQTHIQDLKDISRYINSINVERFTEAYLDLGKEKTNFDYVLSKNNSVKLQINILWVVNLILIGSIFFI